MLEESIQMAISLVSSTFLGRCLSMLGTRLAASISISLIGHHLSHHLLPSDDVLAQQLGH